MTPEEYQEGNPLRSTRPADYLEKKVTLLSALLAFRALTQVTAVLHQEGRLDSKKSSNVLAVIDEIKTTASLALDIRDAQEDCLDEEDNLPELADGDDSDSEDGFLDQNDYEIAEHHLRKLGESKPKAEAAFCDDKLKGDQPVTLPLARPSVYKLGAGPKRKKNPLACFQTDIYARIAQQPEYQAETSAAGASAGDHEMQKAGQEQVGFPGLDCWLPTPANKVLKEEDMREAYHTLMDARSPLNTLDQMTSLTDIPNIWELDQPLLNPEYYERCWLYDFPRPAQNQAEALHHQLELAAKMTADLIDEPRGEPLIFTYMVGAEE
eukprot:gene15405-18232_t